MILELIKEKYNLEGIRLTFIDLLDALGSLRLSFVDLLNLFEKKKFVHTESAIQSSFKKLVKLDVFILYKRRKILDGGSLYRIHVVNFYAYHETYLDYNHRKFFKDRVMIVAI